MARWRRYDPRRDDRWAAVAWLLPALVLVVTVAMVLLRG